MELMQTVLDSMLYHTVTNDLTNINSASYLCNSDDGFLIAPYKICSVTDLFFFFLGLTHFVVGIFNRFHLQWTMTATVFFAAYCYFIRFWRGCIYSLNRAEFCRVCLAVALRCFPKTRVKIYLNIIFCLFDMYSFVWLPSPSNRIERCSTKINVLVFRFMDFCTNTCTFTKCHWMYRFCVEDTHTRIRGYIENVCSCVYVFAFHLEKENKYLHIRYWIIQPEKFHTMRRKFILTT